MNQKGLGNIIFIVTAIVVVIGLGYVVVRISQTRIAPTSSIPETPTNWLNHRVEGKDGFTFKYPPTFVLSEFPKALYYSFSSADRLNPEAQLFELVDKARGCYIGPLSKGGFSRTQYTSTTKSFETATGPLQVEYYHPADNSQAVYAVIPSIEEMLSEKGQVSSTLGRGQSPVNSYFSLQLISLDNGQLIQNRQKSPVTSPEIKGDCIQDFEKILSTFTSTEIPVAGLEIPKFVTSLTGVYQAPRALSVETAGFYRGGRGNQKTILKLIEENGVGKELAIYKNSNFQSVKFSPDGASIAFTHWGTDPFEGPEDAQFVYAGLSVVNTKGTPVVRDIIPSGRYGIADFSWSLDGKYIAVLVAYNPDDYNPSYVSEIWELANNRVVLSIKPTQELVDQALVGVSAIKWLKQNRFSYSIDGNLYIGTLENPKETLIAQDVAYLHAWSSNERYAVFHSKSGFEVLDAATRRRIKLGIACASLDEECFSTDEVRILPQEDGWYNETFYYFGDEITNPKDPSRSRVRSLMSVTMPEGIIRRYPIDLEAGYPKTGGQSVDFSADGQYVAYQNPGQYGNGFPPVSVYKRDTKTKVCPDLIKGYQHAWSRKDPRILFLFLNSSNDLPIPGALTGDLIDPDQVIAVDVSKCSVLGNIKLVTPDLSSLPGRENIDWSWQIFSE